MLEDSIPTMIFFLPNSDDLPIWELAESLQNGALACSKNFLFQVYGNIHQLFFDAPHNFSPS